MRPELDNAGPQMPVLASWQPLSTEGRRPGGDTATEVFGAGLLFRACRPWCRLDSAFGDESVWEVEVRLPVGGAVETGAWGGETVGRCQVVWSKPAAARAVSWAWVDQW
jgi:hypothetical protein